MASLVDTNILVYCFDPREPVKRAQARKLLRQGAIEKTLLLPHQALVEFVFAVTRRRGNLHPLLIEEEAIRQTEGFMIEFPVLYPDEHMLRTALRGMAAYRLCWFDAQLWAYAEHYGVGEILSEDFEHGRRYGTVRVRNPFLGLT